MCGICGIISFDHQAVKEVSIRNMMAIQKHRGPDDEGVFLEDNVGLGFVRLSIIDLSAAGHHAAAGVPELHARLDACHARSSGGVAGQLRLRLVCAYVRALHRALVDAHAEELHVAHNAGAESAQSLRIGQQILRQARKSPNKAGKHRRMEKPVPGSSTQWARGRAGRAARHLPTV